MAPWPRLEKPSPPSHFLIPAIPWSAHLSKAISRRGNSASFLVCVSTTTACHHRLPDIPEARQGLCLGKPLSPPSRLSPSSAGYPGGTAVVLSGQAVTPRLGAVWQLAPSFAPYGQFAKGFRAPTPDQVNNGFTN